MNIPSKIKEVVEAGLSISGVNSTYAFFDKTPPGDYATWFFDRTVISGSDDGRHRILHADIEISLFTTDKALTSVQSILDAFPQYDIRIQFDYDESENLYHITFSFTVTVTVKVNTKN